MTIGEAQRLLGTHRPGIDSEADPQIQAALALARENRELGKWFEEQQRFHAGVRGALDGIEPPAGLKERILLQSKVTPFPSRRRFLWSSAAAAGVMLAAGMVWWRQSRREDRSFANFQSRMVSFALREYRMDVESSDAATVREHLKAKGAPAEFPVPERLAAQPVKGGASLQWHGKPVAMMCFDWKGADTLYLFVIRASEMDGGTLGGPEVKEFKGITTVHWQAGETRYLLVGRPEPEALRKLVS